jgi:replicative DNA helicase
MADRQQLEQSIIKTILFSEELIQSAIDSKLIESDFECQPYKKIYAVLCDIWKQRAPKVKLDTLKIVEFIRFNDIDIDICDLVGLQDELPTLETVKNLKKYIKFLKHCKGRNVC